MKEAGTVGAISIAPAGKGGYLWEAYPCRWLAGWVLSLIDWYLIGLEGPSIDVEAVHRRIGAPGAVGGDREVVSGQRHSQQSQY